MSVSGHYLAARHAGAERDAAAAAAYYRAALRGDPRNNELLNRAFLAVLANGEVEEAVRLAERVLQADKNDRIARPGAWRARAISRSNTGSRASSSPNRSAGRSPISPRRCCRRGRRPAPPNTSGNRCHRQAAGPDWYGFFKELHAGLILDQAGQKKDAARRYERAYKLDPTDVRVVQAYGSYLSRQGNKDEALKVFKAFDECCRAIR